jgi:hypothetical protein
LWKAIRKKASSRRSTIHGAGAIRGERLRATDDHQQDGSREDPQERSNDTNIEEEVGQDHAGPLSLQEIVNAEPSVDSANEDNLPLADVGMVSIPQTDLEEESMRAAVIHLWATTDDIPMAAVIVSTSQTGHRERITYSPETSHREL